MYCIVGFPNISKFASIIDPIISGVGVQEFLNHLQLCEGGGGRVYNNNQLSILSNSLMSQQMIQPSMMTQQMPLPSMIHNNNLDNNQQDTNVDDLHLYEFQNILLEKKERVMLPIFDVELDYKDAYHCKIDALHYGDIYPGYHETKPYEEVIYQMNVLFQF